VPEEHLTAACAFDLFGMPPRSRGGSLTFKRALVIAAADAHNLLMLGPPGSGRNEDT
jgi:hypothetical protein